MFVRTLFAHTRSSRPRRRCLKEREAFLDLFLEEDAIDEGLGALSVSLGFRSGAEHQDYDGRPSSDDLLPQPGAQAARVFEYLVGRREPEALEPKRTVEKFHFDGGFGDLVEPLLDVIGHAPDVLDCAFRPFVTARFTPS